MKNYLSKKSIGFYLILASVVAIILGFIFSLVDGNKNIAIGLIIIIFSILAIALPIILEVIQTLLKKNIDRFNLLPIVLSILLMVVLVTYIGERVDVLGYIFTNHYTFQDDYPYLFLGLLFDIIALLTAIVGTFFRMNKQEKESA